MYLQSLAPENTLIVKSTEQNPLSRTCVLPAAFTTDHLYDLLLISPLAHVHCSNHIPILLRHLPSNKDSLWSRLLLPFRKLWTNLSNTKQVIQFEEKCFIQPSLCDLTTGQYKMRAEGHIILEITALLGTQSVKKAEENDSAEPCQW